MTHQNYMNSQPVRITKQEIEERYHRYNEAYFAGKLPRRMHFDTYVGKTSFGIATLHSHKKCKDKIEIARNVQWSEADLKSTIVHEMVHLYLWYYDPRYGGKNPLYNRPHGILFRREGRRLREQYGIDILSKPKSKVILTGLKGRMVYHNRLAQAIADWIFVRIL